MEPSNRPAPAALATRVMRAFVALACLLPLGPAPWSAAAETSAGRNVSATDDYPIIPSQAALDASSRLPNPLMDFALALKETAPEPQSLADFAWIALDEMVSAYGQETLSLEAAGGIPLNHPKARWVIATREYAQRLRAIAESLSAGSAVEIRADAPGMLLLFVDGQIVEVSGPRIAEPNYMGKRIIDRYCEIHDCGFFEAGAEPREQAPPPTIEAVWSFSAGRGPVCVTSNGLEFQFKDLSHLARKRSACLQVAEQLRDLTEALRRAADTGVIIDWPALDIVATSAGIPEQVVLNGRGDYLLVSVPSLAASRPLRDLSMAWIRARLRGEPIFQSFPHAEQLLAPLLPAG
ncbi:MAG: hypothetical protein R3174_01555 [Gammaproteobacteria bacterium]|nr:hypothetical protein [Gammaproteobacteria bacterium]